MKMPHPLPDDLVELIARRFRVLGEPMRIKLLDRLREGEASVNELAEALGASQQNISQHLKVLTEVGILGRRKEADASSTTGSSTRASSPSASRSAARCTTSCGR